MFSLTVYTITQGLNIIGRIHRVKTFISEHRCPELQVDNGTVSPSGAVNQNNVVTVTCSKRYVLIGHKEVTCQSTGWETIPVCKKCSEFDSLHMILIFLIEIRTVYGCSYNYIISLRQNH